MDKNIDDFIDSLNYQLQIKEQFYKKIPFSDQKNINKMKPTCFTEEVKGTKKNYQEIRRHNIYKVLIKEYMQKVKKKNI
ncbi:MAG: hypothetical protein R6U96_07400 [Promethearchaeia archaeon]